MIQFAIVSAIAAVLVSLFGFAFWLEKKRIQALQQLAEQLGLEFRLNLEEPDASHFRIFGISREGRNRVSKNAIIAETDSVRMVLFDHQYVVGSGKQQSTHRFAIIMCSSPQLKLPTMVLEPETWGDKFAAFFGKKDIDFEGDEPFSKQFRITGSDETAIRDFLNVDKRKQLLQRPNERLHCIEDTFLLLRKSAKLTGDSIHKYMEEGLIVAKLLGVDPLQNENSPSKMDEEFEIEGEPESDEGLIEENQESDDQF